MHEAVHTGMTAMEKENFITTKILKYLEFWNLNMLKDPKYANMMKPYNDY